MVSRPLLPVVLAALAGLGCSFDRGTLTLHLVQSSNPGEDPLPDPADAIAEGRTPEVTAIRLRVEGDDMGVIEKTFDFEGRGGKATISEVPVGSGRLVSVEGLGPNGVVFSRGSTLPLNIRAGRSSLTLYLGRVGRFSSTPAPMRASRAFHAAVLLGDGRLVLVGGAGAVDRQAGQPFAVSDVRDTIEILDPTSASFDSGAVDCAVALPRDCLGRGRALATATVLPAGVLVAGGEDESGPLEDAELLDPARRLFSPGGELTEPRSRHAAAVLDGAAVLFGGRGDAGMPGATDRFSGGRFSPGPNLTPREAATATVLADGRVLVAGGRDGDGTTLPTVEIYDGTAITAAAPLAQARAYHTATLLPDGRVLVLGGLAGVRTVPGAEVYDPAADVWSAIEATPLDRWAHAATLLPDGRILVTGGFGGGEFGGPRREVEILDATHLGTSGTEPLRGLVVTPISPLFTGRAGHSATVLGNGLVLVAGGVGPNNAPLATAEVLVLER